MQMIGRHLLEGLFIGSELAVIVLFIARQAGLSIGYRVRGNVFAEELHGFTMLDWASILFLALGIVAFFLIRLQPRQ